ncbi:phage holin, lambda family [Enterobacillus tribolii]|uniref:Lambda family phage holin n=1 Tax=Enterobacillus tribolii TaxID=1487935 RepID=A0A370QQ88_9GAMM|nr:phage holin, lambda family [Enterobacillus tribolii]MBW7981555.1 phage holin, lambda family [Enterobacillus tribolii]RDK90932.1 lambda family phage holin [Enterobacillus tribolii]
MTDKTPEVWSAVLAWLVSVKEQGVGAMLAATMAYLRGRYNGGKFWRVLIDALMCAMLAWFIRDLLDLIGLKTNLAYIGSIMVGYLGTDYFGTLLRRLIGNKTNTGSSDADK